MLEHQTAREYTHTGSRDEGFKVLKARHETELGAQADDNLCATVSSTPTRPNMRARTNLGYPSLWDEW